MSPTSPHATPRASRYLVPLALATLYLVWGSTYLGIRFALESWPPFLLAAIRFLFAGGVLYAWLRLRGAAAPTRLQWRNAAITGTLLLTFGTGFVCFAELYVSSGVAAVAIASMPLFMALFEGWYGNWPNRRETLGLIVGFAGVIVLNLGDSLSGSRIGALALLIAAAAWAFGSVWSKRRDMPRGAMNVAAQMLCGGVSLVVLAFATGERWPAAPTLGATLALAYLAVFGSLIAFSAYLYALAHARPVLATSYAYVNPPVAVLFGIVLAGEHAGAFELAGMAIILVGVAAITLGHRRQH